MSDLTYETRGHTAWLTISRPDQGNTITMDGISQLWQCLEKAEADRDVRVVCLTGQGEKIFCAGADLGGTMQASDGEKQATFDAYAGLLLRISQFPKPTVARVNGHCLAGGMGFMLACDIVIASHEAKFGTPEVNVGLFPMMIGALIFRNVLRKKAMEMILLGEKLSAAQALDMGLVTRICASEELAAETEKVLDALASKSPIGLKIGKQAFNTCQDLALEPALFKLAQGLEAVAGTRDAVEGITAFLEKRKPEFTGE